MVPLMPRFLPRVARAPNRLLRKAANRFHRLEPNRKMRRQFHLVGRGIHEVDDQLAQARHDRRLARYPFHRYEWDVAWR